MSKKYIDLNLETIEEYKLEEDIRRNDDSEENQQVKYIKHKVVNSTIKNHIENGNLLSAYCLSFSLLEDRVKSYAYVYARDIKKSKNPTKCINIEFARIAGGLQEDKLISEVVYKNLRTIAYNRNKLIHEAMWRMDVDFTPHIHHVLDMRKIISNSLEKLKRQIAKDKKAQRTA